MFLLDGKPLGLDVAFTDAQGYQYPANWLRLSSAEEKAAIGITEVADPVRADDRFYWNGDVNLPKDLTQLQAQFVAQIKQTAGSILSQTDWMVIRKAERNVDIPAETVTYRAAVVARADELETAINETADVAELAALDLSFPSNEA